MRNSELIDKIEALAIADQNIPLDVIAAAWEQGLDAQAIYDHAQVDHCVNQEAVEDYQHPLYEGVPMHFEN
jgi:hypothetical protein